MSNHQLDQLRKAAGLEPLPSGDGDEGGGEAEGGSGRVKRKPPTRQEAYRKHMEALDRAGADPRGLEQLRRFLRRGNR